MERVFTIMAAALGVSACLEPMVDDTIVREDRILEPGADVPLLSADPVAQGQLEDSVADVLDGLVAARHAFCEGAPVVWWDLGPASSTPVAAYVLVAERGSGEYLADGRRLAALDHPFILTAIPGDLAYSPLVKVVLVPVTERYAGETLTSVEALDAALAAGLTEAPLKIPYVRTSPVVPAASRLEPAPGVAPVAPVDAYYAGRVVHRFDLGLTFAPGMHLPVSTQYALRREGGEAISEVERAVDLTGDGDINDTNDLFAHAPGQVGFSPLVRVTEVVVAADLKAIDTYGRSDTSDLDSAAELFGDDGVTLDTAVVRGIAATATVRLRPFVPALATLLEVSR